MTVFQEGFDFCRGQCAPLLFSRRLGHADSAFPVATSEGVSVGITPADGRAQDPLHEHQDLTTSLRLHFLGQRWQEITLDSSGLDLVDEVVLERFGPVYQQIATEAGTPAWRSTFSFAISARISLTKTIPHLTTISAGHLLSSKCAGREQARSSRAASSKRPARKNESRTASASSSV